MDGQRRVSKAVSESNGRQLKVEPEAWRIARRSGEID